MDVKKIEALEKRIADVISELEKTSDLKARRQLLRQITSYNRQYVGYMGYHFSLPRYIEVRDIEINNEEVRGANPR